MVQHTTQCPTLDCRDRRKSRAPYKHGESRKQEGRWPPLGVRFHLQEALAMLDPLEKEVLGMQRQRELSLNTRSRVGQF